MPADFQFPIRGVGATYIAFLTWIEGMFYTDPSVGEISHSVSHSYPVLKY